MSQEHSVRTLCALFQVSPSGFYDWRARRQSPGPRTLANQKLEPIIEQIFKDSRRTYGSPRITEKLRQRGEGCGRNRIARLMRQLGLCGRAKRRYRVQTTDSRHAEPIAPNGLGTAPAPTGRDQQWVADITYVQTREGWLYLAAILDRYSRRIVGWAMGLQIDTALVLRALQMAVQHRQPPAGLLLHSDRGVQYASREYRQALASAGLIASMSRKANCYDNAAMESFWSTLKLELVYRTEFASRATATTQIFDYIEIFYNRQRLHSSLHYLCPVDFELQNN